MQELSVQGHSKKRAAAEPTQGHASIGGRPAKIQPNSTEDNFACSSPRKSAGLITHEDVDELCKFPFNHQTTPPPALEVDQVVPSISRSSPVLNKHNDKDYNMLQQPETRPITQEQLVNEIRGTYTGLVTIERRLVEIDQRHTSTTDKLPNKQWQALITLHRTLLHEHHDFFLASQHPSSSPALCCLATKYPMSARMWRHGIYSFFELLRHRLPDSLAHMLTFVYLAYSTMTFLSESVPSFEKTWINCLGDLARCRMTIEEADLPDREVWSGVARMWYNKAANSSHHLTVLARPNVMQRLFYSSKALVSVASFQNVRESVMLLFNPFLEDSEIASQRYPLLEPTLVRSRGALFTRGTVFASGTQVQKTMSASMTKHQSLTSDESRRSHHAAPYACQILPIPTTIALQHTKDTNELPYVHVLSGRGNRYRDWGNLVKCVTPAAMKYIRAVALFAQRISSDTAVLISLCALPMVHAAPTSSQIATESSRSTGYWVNASTFGCVMAWTAACGFALLVDQLGHRLAKGDTARYGVLSCGASVASLIFVDAQALAEIRWPTLAVGFDFLVRYYSTLAKQRGMGLGYLATTLGLGISMDAWLVHLASGSQGGGQELFPRLLLICLWLSLFMCSCVAQLLRHDNSTQTPPGVSEV
jgi:hypothetical protein